MKTTQRKTQGALDSFDFISNELQEELQEEFANVFNSLDDAIIRD